MTLELAIALYLEARRLLGNASLPSTGPLWDGACKYYRDVRNPTARVKETPDVHSPYRTFFGSALAARLFPFLKPGFHHVKKTLNSDPKA